jgi:phage tail protein X
MVKKPDKQKGMNTEYTTQTGDTIYSVASKAYGDPLLFQTILDANPTLPIIPLYPAGLVVIIPVVENVDPITTNSLPPWKQNA